jgi:hypothetical protein
MKILVLILLLVGSVIGWHLCIAMPKGGEYYRLFGNATETTVNPITDVVTWHLESEVEFQNRENPPIGHMGQMEAVWKVEKQFTPTIPSMEYKFNLHAREYLDVYALLLPYRVVIDAGNG